jgi:hypothetical protein
MRFARGKADSSGRIEMTGNMGFAGGSLTRFRPNQSSELSQVIKILCLSEVSDGLVAVSSRALQFFAERAV